MKKALEILKDMREQNNDADKNALIELDEAIAELEAQEAKSCYICKFFREHDRYQCGYCAKGVTNRADNLRVVDYKFSCNQFEPKSI